MIGGKIKQVYKLPDRQSVWVVDTNGDELAVDVVKNDDMKLLPGDSFWWQSRHAYWTAQTPIAIHDVPIERIGYSYKISTLIKELCVAGVCPDCGNDQHCMHDGEGRLWCPVCGASYDFSDV